MLESIGSDGVTSRLSLGAAQCKTLSSLFWLALIAAAASLVSLLGLGVADVAAVAFSGDIDLVTGLLTNVLPWITFLEICWSEIGTGYDVLLSSLTSTENDTDFLFFAWNLS
jgi:hypothetical protein